MNLKTDLSKFNNSWYKPGSYIEASGLVHGAWRFCSGHPFLISSVKVTMLRLFGARVGNGVVIKPHVRIKYPWRLIIGNHVWIGEDCWIDNLAQVTIGNSVCLSQGSFLLCGNHDFSKSTFDLMIGEIVLEDGVWIGAKSTVCPGVVCSSHAVLAVGSVATKNLEPYSIYQGNPAVKIKERILSA
jgi:putative colanic acid biosynthesis acetyltransferase WcaF